MTNSIELTGISKSYGNLTALGKVDLTVKRNAGQGHTLRLPATELGDPAKERLALPGGPLPAQ